MQLQSIMRPLWKSIGYKGASFEVSDRAIGSDKLLAEAGKIDIIFGE